jgi:hypothetical protein
MTALDLYSRTSFARSIALRKEISGEIRLVDDDVLDCAIKEDSHRRYWAYVRCLWGKAVMAETPAESLQFCNAHTRQVLFNECILNVAIFRSFPDACQVIQENPVSYSRQECEFLAEGLTTLRSDMDARSFCEQLPDSKYRMLCSMFAAKAKDDPALCRESEDPVICDELLRSEDWRLTAWESLFIPKQ